jgi:hypothetical protein
MSCMPVTSGAPSHTTRSARCPATCAITCTRLDRGGEGQKTNRYLWDSDHSWKINKNKEVNITPIQHAQYSNERRSIWNQKLMLITLSQKTQNNSLGCLTTSI